MKHFLYFFIFLSISYGLQARSWTADNGNGTFTNPLFYDEFTDPDMIRVGTDFYMVASSMHAMPGLPLLRSKDLVNWEFVTYVFNKLDMGPEFHLEGKKGVYGNGIWAPAIRYHEGRFYIFVNVNDHGLQVFTAERPEGPWTHKNMGGRIYDLGVLFDDDGKIYAVHGYDEVHLIEIKADFSGYVEGSDRVIIPKGNAMGEGHHFYKINRKYYIISADYSPVGRMQCARADRPEGPFIPLPDPIRGSYSMDICVFEENGEYYLYFGGLWGGQLQRYKDNKALENAYLPEGAEPSLPSRVVRLTDDMLQFAEEPKPVQVVDEEGKPLRADDPHRFFEASWLHKYNGKYYFSYSTGDSHLLCYAIGDNPYGPFTYKGVILTPVVGWTTHHSIVEYKGKWYLFHHDSVPSGGKSWLRSLKVCEIEYDDNGLIKTIEGQD